MEKLLTDSLANYGTFGVLLAALIALVWKGLPMLGRGLASWFSTTLGKLEEPERLRQASIEHQRELKDEIKELKQELKEIKAEFQEYRKHAEEKVSRLLDENEDLRRNISENQAQASVERAHFQNEMRTHLATIERQQSIISEQLATIAALEAELKKYVTLPAHQNNAPD